MGKLLPKKSGLPSRIPSFEADLQKLIDKFVLKVQAGTPLKLSNFKDIWRSGKFSFIHQAVPLNVSARDFLQLLYAVALNRLADPSPYLNYRADPSESGASTSAHGADVKAKRAERAKNFLRWRLGASKGVEGEGSGPTQQPGPHVNLAGTTAASTAATNPSGGDAIGGHPAGIEAAEEDPLGQEYDLLAHLDELIGGDLALEPPAQYQFQNPDITGVLNHQHGAYPQPSGCPHPWPGHSHHLPIPPPVVSAGADGAFNPGLPAAPAAPKRLVQPPNDGDGSSSPGITDLVAASAQVKRSSNDVPSDHLGDGQPQACAHLAPAAPVLLAGSQGLEPKPLGWGCGPGLAAEDDYDTDPATTAPGTSGHEGAPLGEIGPMSVWASLIGPTSLGQNPPEGGVEDGQHVGQGVHPHAAWPHGPGPPPGLQLPFTGMHFSGTADMRERDAAAEASTANAAATMAAAWQPPDSVTVSPVGAPEALQGSSLTALGEDVLPCGLAAVNSMASGGISGTTVESSALEQQLGVDFGPMSPSHSAGFSPLRALLAQSPHKGLASPLSKQQPLALPLLPGPAPLPEFLHAGPEVASAPLLPLPQSLLARPGPGLPPLMLPMQPPLSSAAAVQEGPPDHGTGSQQPGAGVEVFAAQGPVNGLPGAAGDAGISDTQGRLYTQVPSNGMREEQQTGGPTDTAGLQAEATNAPLLEPWDMATLLQTVPAMPPPPPVEQRREGSPQQQGQPLRGMTATWVRTNEWAPAPAGADLVAGVATETAALMPSPQPMQPRVLTTIPAPGLDMAPTQMMGNREDEGSGLVGQDDAPAAADAASGQTGTAATAGPATDILHPEQLAKVLAALPPPGPDVPLAARAGSIFALYCLYGTQLCQPAVRIYVPLPLLSSLAATVQEAAAAGLMDVVAVVRTMWRQGVLVPGGVARFPGACTPRMPGLRGRPRLVHPDGTDAAAGGPQVAGSRILAVDIHARRRGAAFNEILVSNPVLRQALLHLRTALPMLADMEGFERLCEEYGERRAAIFRGSAAATAAADGDGVTPDALFEPRVGGDVRRSVRGMFAEVLQALRRAPAHRVRALERRRQRELQAEREAEEAAREAAEAAAAPRTVAQALAEVAVKPLAPPRRHVAGELGALMRRRATQAGGGSAAAGPGASGRGAGAGISGWGPISTGSRHRVVVIRHKSELVSAGLMGEEGSKAQALPGVPTRVLQAEAARRQRVQSVADTWLTRHDQLMRNEQQPQPGPQQPASRDKHAAGEPGRPTVTKATTGGVTRPSGGAVSGSRQQPEPPQSGDRRVGREKKPEPESKVEAQGQPEGEEDLDDDFDVDAELAAAFEELEAAADMPTVDKPGRLTAVAAQDAAGPVMGRGRGSRGPGRGRAAAGRGRQAGGRAALGGEPEAEQAAAGGKVRGPALPLLADVHPVLSVMCAGTSGTMDCRTRTITCACHSCATAAAFATAASLRRGSSAGDGAAGGAVTAEQAAAPSPKPIAATDWPDHCGLPGGKKKWQTLVQVVLPDGTGLDSDAVRRPSLEFFLRRSGLALGRASAATKPPAASVRAVTDGDGSSGGRGRGQGRGTAAPVTAAKVRGQGRGRGRGRGGRNGKREREADDLEVSSKSEEDQAAVSSDLSSDDNDDHDIAAGHVGSGGRGRGRGRGTAAPGTAAKVRGQGRGRGRGRGGRNGKREREADDLEVSSKSKEDQAAVGSDLSSDDNDDHDIAAGHGGGGGEGDGQALAEAAGQGRRGGRGRGRRGGASSRGARTAAPGPGSGPQGKSQAGPSKRRRIASPVKPEPVLPLGTDAEELLEELGEADADLIRQTRLALQAQREALEALQRMRPLQQQEGVQEQGLAEPGGSPPGSILVPPPVHTASHPQLTAADRPGSASKNAPGPKPAVTTSQPKPGMEPQGQQQGQQQRGQQQRQQQPQQTGGIAVDISRRQRQQRRDMPDTGEGAQDAQAKLSSRKRGASRQRADEADGVTGAAPELRKAANRSQARTHAAGQPVAAKRGRREQQPPTGPAAADVKFTAPAPASEPGARVVTAAALAGVPKAGAGGSEATGGRQALESGAAEVGAAGATDAQAQEGSPSTKGDETRQGVHCKTGPARGESEGRAELRPGDTAGIKRADADDEDDLGDFDDMFAALKALNGI